ncbi:MAG TPA: DsbA family oxidoreductase [Cyclobacteriaceae bacterium]|nr:DsbA family oxidoreductase [Cyclobacteriaceae bacterium]
MKQRITIEVVSDVVCPWCYIGKRRMEKAIDILRDKFEFEVTFSPFELNPDMPPQGTDQKAYLTAKFGGTEKYEQITAHVAGVARGEGLSFDFSKQNVSPNTRDAHRIIMLAAAHNVQPAVNEALMKAYFEEGIDLSSRDELISIAVQAGLNKKDLTEMFATDGFLTDVISREQINYQRGISGVPFFIINNKYGVSGAQPTAAFIEIFNQVVSEVIPQGETCDPNGKNC